MEILRYTNLKDLFEKKKNKNKNKYSYVIFLMP